MAVKLWAKENNIGSAQDNGLSSYAWTNLVIFYLQCLDFVPNLQCKDLMRAVGFQPDPQGNYWHSVNRLETFYMTWEEVKSSGAWTQPSKYCDTPHSVLLYGFFEFYSCRFPLGSFAVSIKQGRICTLKLASRKSKLIYCIEDPFETFDSHYPHDLGTPANETGTREILECMANAEEHLRKILLEKIDSAKLWPISSRANPNSGEGNSNQAAVKGKHSEDLSLNGVTKEEGRADIAKGHNFSEQTQNQNGGHPAIHSPPKGDSKDTTKPQINKKHNKASDPSDSNITKKQDKPSTGTENSGNKHGNPPRERCMKKLAEMVVDDVEVEAVAEEVEAKARVF